MAFPNLKNKYKGQSIITPRQFLQYLKNEGGYPKFRKPKGVIFCYSLLILKYIKKKYKAKKVSAFSGETYLIGNKGNQIAIVGNFGIGAPIVATIMEEFIAMGVKKFISIGDAGSIQKSLDIGDIVICDRAIRDEGVSHHYMKSAPYATASKSMTMKIEKILKRRNLKYFKGASWTIDSPYRETISEIKRYQRQGVLTVEMEAAAIFAVAKYRKVIAGALFVVSDNLGELIWEPKFHLTTKPLEEVFEIAKESLL